MTSDKEEDDAYRRGRTDNGRGVGGNDIPSDLTPHALLRVLWQSGWLDAELAKPKYKGNEL